MYSNRIRQCKYLPTFKEDFRRETNSIYNKVVNPSFSEYTLHDTCVCVQYDVTLLRLIMIMANKLW